MKDRKHTWKLNWRFDTHRGLSQPEKNKLNVCEHAVKIAATMCSLQIEKDLNAFWNISIRFPCALFFVFHMETSSFYW